MSLLEDFPANHSASQENKKEQTTTAISGQKCLDSLGRSNPNSLLGRMCRDLLTSKTAWYSDRCKTNWKVKVSKSNVSLFQLQASVLGTKGTESGLWLTPSTTDYSQRSPNAGTKKIMEGHRKDGENNGSTGRTIESKSKYGKPRDGYEDVSNTDTRLSIGENEEVQTRRDTSTISSENVSNTDSSMRGRGRTIPLSRENKVWGFRVKEKRIGDNVRIETIGRNDILREDVPNTNSEGLQGLGLSTNMETEQGSIGSENSVEEQNKPGGKLNPTFVEFLMGFPMNWTKTELTESKPSVTQSSHKSQESSDSQSKKFYRTPTAMDKGDNSFKYAAKILKGKLNRSESKQPVQKTLSMDVMEHLKNNPTNRKRVRTSN